MSKRKKPPDIDITNLMSQIEREQAEAERAGREAIATACEQLIALGVTQVHISYDGYGDSGSIESVYAYAGEQEVDLPKALEGMLADAAEKLLPLGYENNDGAFGELALDVAARKITREHSWRVSETEYEEVDIDLDSPAASADADSDDADQEVVTTDRHEPASPNEALTIKVAVAGTNPQGEPDLAFVQIRCTQDQIDRDEHLAAAEQWAEENDYEAPFVAFDEFDTAGQKLMQFFVWESAITVDISQDGSPSS